jgi:thiol-disulfide isomerase/thioredoxin
MNRRDFIQCACAAAANLVGAGARAQAPAPSLSGQTLDGRPYDLRPDLGKVVLVFFWSTACPVCRDKMPELRLNYEAWRDKRFQLLAVSMDKSLGELRAYDAILNRVVPPAQRFPWVWRGAAVHRDNFGNVSQTPTSFLLDRQGQVVKVFRGRIEASLWDDIAELVLN